MKHVTTREHAKGSIVLRISRAVGTGYSSSLGWLYINKAGHEYTCGSPGSVPAGHEGQKNDTWIDPDPWETGTRTRGSRFGGYFPRIYLQVLAGITKVVLQYHYFYAIKPTFYEN